MIFLMKSNLFKLKQEAFPFFDSKYHGKAEQIEYWDDEKVSNSALEKISILESRFYRLAHMSYLDIMQTHEYEQILDLWRNGEKPYQIAETLSADPPHIYKIMRKLSLVD